MSTAAYAFAAAARSLVGTRFLLHGRSRTTGLDCVGLVLEALRLIGRPTHVPADYGLRNRDFGPFLHHFPEAGFLPCADPPCAGDLIMVRPGPAQGHLLVAMPQHSFVHAHAGLGKVVETPAPLAWDEWQRWRLQDL
ncbi:hypothetical protein [Alteraurantiacibacter palmitatis]|uniref:Peptidoglycan endopeptidase n=1 Tax=Alteraurantiacibacter palmitatis TaxID=2054628 RepID=A0ABV7E8R7_9SPHN